MRERKKSLNKSGSRWYHVHRKRKHGCRFEKGEAGKRGGGKIETVAEEGTVRELLRECGGERQRVTAPSDARREAHMRVGEEQRTTLSALLFGVIVCFWYQLADTLPS